MRAYAVLCVSTHMQRYDVIYMLAYALLCRAAPMHCYEFDGYAFLCSDMIADYHMQPYARLCKSSYEVLCVSVFMNV